MAKQMVRRGSRYRATISLGFIERLASNELIAKQFVDLGFEDVHVSGQGATRIAEALWPLPDTEGEMPSQIADFVEL